MADQITTYLFQYYGVDWIVMITVFVAMFLLGDKKRSGFIVGMISASFAFIFGIQVGSIANIIIGVVLFILYLRGYMKWGVQK